MPEIPPVNRGGGLPAGMAVRQDLYCPDDFRCGYWWLAGGYRWPMLKRYSAIPLIIFWLLAQSLN